MKPYAPEIIAALSRRSFLKTAAFGAGAVALPGLGRRALAAGETPHLFLLVTISGGLDNTYLFDARPLAMTDRNRIQNYCYKPGTGGTALPDAAPRVMTGSNGTTTLRSPLTDGLMQYASDFSVVNGVCMLTNGFVGHGNNMYHLFTNSPNPGRDSFVPSIGAQGKRPLESVHIGGWEGDGNVAPTNFASSIQLYPGQGGNLANALKAGPQLDLQSASMKHVLARLAANAAGTGKFSIGSKKMQSAFEKAPALAETLKNVDASIASGNEFLSSLEIAVAYLKGGVTSAMTIMYDRDPVLDVHDGFGAAQQPKLFAEVLRNLEAMFEKLKSTAYDEAAGLSMLDVTTVMVTTEFSRTMIQYQQQADKTGTDHNPLTNSVLLAGKGIKGGQVFGASDLADVDEAGELKDVSAAHKEKDPSLTSIMGKPFDFASEKPRADLPAAFAETDYLNFPSVANSVMSLFNVPTPQQFRIGSNTAPILKGLLK